MIESYEPFCLASPHFFEPPERLDDRDSQFEASTRPVPPGWVRLGRQSWLVMRPENAPMPTQGWKVHASASLAQADRVLTLIWDFCVAHTIAFKFQRSRAALHA